MLARSQLDDKCPPLMPSWHRHQPAHKMILGSLAINSSVFSAALGWNLNRFEHLFIAQHVYSKSSDRIYCRHDMLFASRESTTGYALDAN